MILLPLAIIIAIIIAIIGAILIYYVNYTLENNNVGIAESAGRAGRAVTGGNNPSSFEAFCYPKSYKVQEHQKFVGDYMSPDKKHNSMLVFHRIGGGKTCASIQIGEKWLKRGKPLFIMPASLIPGFRNELRSGCAGEKYIKSADAQKLKNNIGSLEWQAVIDASDLKINSAYDLMSYDSFRIKWVNEVLTSKPPILIIDEVQNVTNPKGETFRCLLEFIQANPKMPVVLMTATPIFDHPEEIMSLAKMLRADVFKDVLNFKDIRTVFAGKVSYFAGAPDYTYPKVTVDVLPLLMSAFQTKWYLSEVEAEKNKAGLIKIKEVPNSFYIKSRQRANVVYPSGLSGAEGLQALMKKLHRGDLKKYSVKAAKLLSFLKSGRLSFVYSPFTGAGGIEFYTSVLHEAGWRDFNKYGSGAKRYAVWSGGQTLKDKNKIREVFNSSSNDDGSKIQVVVGSPAIKEGVSLMRVRQVHILEGYWNHSRLEQIYGRAVRYCSHKSLPEADRTVNIYIYAAYTKKIPKSIKITPEVSIDAYMLKIADEKREEAEPYVKALMDCAVD